MATIKLGAALADIRGKVGGAIFSRNKGGAYMKAFTKPTNPRTNAQQERRALFGTLMSQWRNLSQAQRNSFINNSVNYPQTNKVGEVSILSGAQLYVKCNMTLLGAGLSQINFLPPAPVGLVKAQLGTYNVSNPFTWDSVLDTPLVANVGIRLLDGIGTADGQWLNFYASDQVSAGINATSSAKRRYIGSVEVPDATQVSGTLYTVDIAALLAQTYGLGPSIYKADAAIFVDVTLYSEQEGIMIPVGTQKYLMDDVGVVV